MVPAEMQAGELEKLSLLTRQSRQVRFGNFSPILPEIGGWHFRIVSHVARAHWSRVRPYIDGSSLEDCEASGIGVLTMLTLIDCRFVQVRENRIADRGIIDFSRKDLLSKVRIFQGLRGSLLIAHMWLHFPSSLSDIS
jgi:hypothetical protein